MGGYEPNPQAWDVAQVPDDWAFGLFDDDYDHFEQHMDQAMARVPALATTGVKQMINGSESFTPDGNFILGRANDCANMFVGAGFNAFGIASGGGAGWVLAEWAMTGQAPMDLWVVDIRRFAAMHKDRDWVRDRTLEAYGKHYTVGFPHEEYASGRPYIKSPLYDRLAAQGAVFGSKLGWERPNWFSDAPGTADVYSMGRQNWFDAVGGEHAHVRDNVGVFDQSSFAKYDLRGAGAMAALDHICAAPLKPVGQLTYTQMLNPRGGIECDLTVARLADQHFYIVTGTGFRTHDFGWINDQLPPGLALQDVTEDWGTLSVMGPKSRDLLATICADDLSNAGFPFGHVRTVTIAGVSIRALRVTYVGELGWELHIPINGLAAVYDAVMAAGHNVRPVGYRALESLRLEKGYRAWSSDITPNDTPFEAGLGWAVKRTSANFIGKIALTALAEKPLTKRFAGFTLDEPDAVLVGRETILRGGVAVGYLTSGGYGYTIGKSVGYGYVRNADGVSDDWLTRSHYALVVAGETLPAQINLSPFYDPTNAKVRA